jgi:hypothetical protein
MDLDRSVVREHNEELMRDAQRWYLQRRLRENREQHLGTRPQIDSSRPGTGVIGVKQERAALMTLDARQERPARSVKTLALGLLGLRRNSYGSTSR